MCVECILKLTLLLPYSRPPRGSAPVPSLCLGSCRPVERPDCIFGALKKRRGNTQRLRQAVRGQKDDGHVGLSIKDFQAGFPSRRSCKALAY